MSYKILNAFFTRDDEPDLILLVEFKDMATFDRSAEYFEAQAKKILGSLDNTRSANIDRGALRTLRGTMVTRELSFTNYCTTGGGPDDRPRVPEALRRQIYKDKGIQLYILF